MRAMRLFGLALAALFMVTSAHALDGGTIDRWIGSMQELQEWSDQHDESLEDDLDAVDDPAEFDFEQMMTRAAQEHAEVEAIAKRHGFNDTGEWAHVGGRIFSAFLALQMEEMAPEMERQMEEAMRQMEESPHMTDEQKAQMRQHMEQQRAAFMGMAEDVPEEDVAAVRAKEAELQRLFDE